jgi:hypothetical protein
MKNLKKKTMKPSTLDVIKAMRRGGREAEMEVLGPVCLQRRCSRSEIKNSFSISLA